MMKKGLCGLSLWENLILITWRNANLLFVFMYENLYKTKFPFWKAP